MVGLKRALKILELWNHNKLGWKGPPRPPAALLLWSGFPTSAWAAQGSTCGFGISRAYLSHCPPQHRAGIPALFVLTVSVLSPTNQPLDFNSSQALP